MFDTLSDQQKEIVNKDGIFIVKACPGSGKTYTVAARLNRLLSEWNTKYKPQQGIAVISYTNVACKEIRNTLKENAGLDITYPHFVGTIDSFLNTYIFLPFAHLLLKNCKERPTIIPDETYWKGTTFKEQFAYMKFNVENKIEFIPPQKRIKKFDEKKLNEMKIGYNKLGYVMQHDVEYFSYLLLVKYPKIAKILIKRFPIFMIDEAQDTTEIQHRIIDVLINNRLTEIMLVGDPDQAIFEWNNAKPELFKDKCSCWEKLEISENRRSSQEICNYFSKISSFSHNSIVAINDDCKNYEFAPEIWEYDINKEIELRQRFINLCNVNGIPLNKAAILCRSQKVKDEIAGIKSTKLNPWREEEFYTYYIVKGKYYFDIRSYRKGYDIFEYGLLYILNKNVRFTRKEREDYILNFGGQHEWRLFLHKLLNEMPSIYIKLGEWINKANKIFENYGIIELKLRITRDTTVNGEKRKFSELNINELFPVDATIDQLSDISIKTIHAAKGESIEAVLVVFKTKTTNNLNYKTALQKNIIDCEEKRIIYVSITRAKKILIIAVPTGQKNYWEKTFEI